MSTKNNTPISHFYHSVKIWWVILFSVSLIVLFVFSLVFLVKHYDANKLWEMNSALFAFLGATLTAGAAIPAISAIFSYLGFIEKHQHANAQLNQIKEQLNEYRVQIENLPDIQTLILEKESEKRFLSYLHNPIDNPYQQWIEQAISKEQSNHYLTLLANAARSLYCFHLEEKEYQTKHDFPALEHRIDLIHNYRQLAITDPLFTERYLLHFSEMLNEFIRSLEYQDEELTSSYQKFIYDWVVDLIAFDEMPTNKTEITDKNIINPILQLYQNGFLNSDQFRNDVKARISFNNRKSIRISTQLGITKPFFTKINLNKEN
ncbi:hypothetical protein [Mannheimia indoligenes]|uniref:hypothetical protein n=1 Tax=Mannheimia indoligenes TaxID=3103145 RepID=UPI002FE6A758